MAQKKKKKAYRAPEWRLLFGQSSVRESEPEYNTASDGHISTTHESSTLEFKREVPRKEILLATLCALANTAGGEVHLGVDDSGKPVGLDESTLMETEERISSWISDGIRPLLIPFISIKMTEKGPIVVIQIGSGSNRPYSCIGNGITYVRIGNTTRRADSATVTRLRLQAMAKTWDEMPASGVTDKDLDPGLIHEYLLKRKFARAIPLPKVPERDWLLKSKYLVNENGRTVPTNAGVLFFHPNPEEILLQSRVELARFAKTDVRDFLDKQTLTGPLWKLPDLAVEFMKKHLPTRGLREGLPGKKYSMRRADFLAYPETAFREIFVNAICHRAYEDPGAAIHVAVFDDMLEITNPGSLLEGLEIRDLGSGISRLRNPVIAKGLIESDLLEGWGSGIRMAQKHLHEVGLPSPTFRLKGFFFQVSSVWRWTSDRTESELDLLNLVTIFGSIATNEAARKLGWSERTTRRILGQLVEKGLLARSGTRKASLYRLS